MDWNIPSYQLFCPLEELYFHNNIPFQLELQQKKILLFDRPLCT